MIIVWIKNIRILENTQILMQMEKNSKYKTLCLLFSHRKVNHRGSKIGKKLITFNKSRN